MNENRSKSVSRRAALGAFGMTGLGAVLAACAGPGDTTATSGATAAGNGTTSGGGTPSAGGASSGGTAPSAGGASSGGTAPSAGGGVSGEVTFTHWRGEDREVFEKLIQKFQSENSGVKVTQNISTSNDYQAQAVQKLTHGGPGDVVASFPGGQLHDFIDANIFSDLSDNGPTKDYVANLITSGAVDGKQYAYPYQLLFLDPIANMDVLSSVGYDESPTNWDAYMDMLDKIKSKGVTPMAYPGANAGNAGQLFNSMVMNVAPSDDMCAKLESGDYKMTDDWFLKLLKHYQDLGPYVQDRAAGTSHEAAQQLYATGKAAMLTTGSYDVVPSRKLGAKFPMNLAPPVTTPKGQKPKYVGAYNASFLLGINSKSQNPEAAMAWLDFLSQTKNAAEYANKTAQFCSVKGIDYTDKDLKALSPWLNKKTILAPRNNQYHNVDVRNTVESTCRKVLTGGDPKKTAESMQKTLDQLVSAGK